MKELLTAKTMLNHNIVHCLLAGELKMSEASHLTAVLACVRTGGKDTLKITGCGATGLD